MLKSINKYLLMASLFILLTIDLIYFINMGFSYLLMDLNSLINDFDIIDFLFFVYSVILLSKSFLLIASIYIILKHKRFFNRKKIVTFLTIFFLLYLFVYLYINLWIVYFDFFELNTNVYLQILGTLIVLLMLYFMVMTTESRLFANTRTKYFYIIVNLIYAIIFALVTINNLSINNLPYIIQSITIIFTSVYIILKMNVKQRDNREPQVSLYK